MSFDDTTAGSSSIAALGIALWLMRGRVEVRRIEGDDGGVVWVVWAWDDGLC